MIPTPAFAAATGCYGVRGYVLWVSYSSTIPYRCKACSWTFLLVLGVNFSVGERYEQSTKKPTPPPKKNKLRDRRDPEVFSAAAPFWGQTGQVLSSLSPKIIVERLLLCTGSRDTGSLNALLGAENVLCLRGYRALLPCSVGVNVE